jgi:phage tail-like protein
MDANRQQFWMLSEQSHWHLIGDPAGLEYDVERRSIKLANQRRKVTFFDDLILAEERLALTPQTLDEFGNRAFLNSETNTIIATGALDNDVEIYAPDADSSEITDLVMGNDGVLYIAIDGRIVMHDRRERWQKQNIEVPELSGFSAWRMAADPEGGVWVLDKDSKKLARVQGMPLHKLAHRSFGPDVSRPCTKNPNPPHLISVEKVVWPNDETPVAIACSLEGNVAVLSWVDNIDSTPAPARYRQVTDQGELTSALDLLGSNHPFSFHWIDKNHIALLLAGVNKESPVYRINLNQPSIWSGGDLYPLKKDFNNGPFLHSLSLPAYYPTITTYRALHRLSFPFFSKLGEASNNPIFTPLDSGNAQMVWHRLYLEAVIPKGCGIKIWLATSDNEVEFSTIQSSDWYEHHFGKMFEQSARSEIPVAVWESQASELPHNPGVLPCATEKNISGLFSVLIQRTNRRVRSLNGRYLHVRVQLLGNGRSTPEIFALRAYGSRFSYINEYLPQFYKESTYQPEANLDGQSTAADFLERFVCNVEGILTNVEDRIANAYLLTNPQTVPDESLSWLASWIGYEINSSLPEQVQRSFLQAASELYRWHGTLRGLKLALEIATQGGISGGEIVVLEDYRLRRTFASIIGADLDDADDQLTAGGAISGNSFVGDTLFIGDENRKEFLALFAADLSVDTREQKDIDALFNKLAHQVTILVHEQVESQDLGLIQQIAHKEIPAHVAFRVLSASNPFLVGMASLVGVDTYLAKRNISESVRVGKSLVGKNDFIKGPAALDPRLEGIGSGTPINPILKPIAFASDETVEIGNNLVLDASGSRAFGERNLTKYNWIYKGKGE